MPTIYTHGGDFHSDELVAIALIQQFACPGEPVELVRTRNKDRLAEALANETAYNDAMRGRSIRGCNKKAPEGALSARRRRSVA